MTDVAISPIISLLTGLIPNAVAGAANGLAIVGSEMAANVTKVNGAAQTATLDTIKAETVLIVEDTGTTLPGTLATIAGYVDTEVGAIKAKTDLIPASPAAVGSQMDLVNAPNATAVTAIVTAIFSYVVDGTLTFLQAIRVKLAVLAGKSSGGGTTTLKFQDTADSKARITATVDSNGNRTGMTLDGT